MMKVQGAFWCIQVVICCLTTNLAPAEPAVVYDNGPVTGPDSWNIGAAAISDSFNVSAPTILTSAHVYLHVASRGIPAVTYWRIGTTPGGTEISSGFAELAIAYLGGSVFDCAF